MIDQYILVIGTLLAFSAACAYNVEKWTVGNMLLVGFPAFMSILYLALTFKKGIVD